MVVAKIRRILKDRKSRLEFRDLLVENIGKEIIVNLQKELVNQDKIVSGRLADSFEYDKPDKVVGSTDEGAADVEYGMPGGTLVPVEALKEWAKVKFALSDKEATSMAFAVQKGIHKNGIPMSRFVKVTLERMVSG